MDICVWDKCNNNCLMCTNPDWPWPAWDGGFDYNYDSLIKRIEKLKDKIKTYDSIYLSGGEPTLNPRFLDVLRYVSQNFPKQRIKLLTNGRKFLYPDFTKKVLEITDNLDIELSIYGPNQKAHQTITRAPGSFEQTIKGLGNLLEYKSKDQLVNVRYIITKLSYQYLEELLKLIKKRFSSVDRIMLIFWEIENQAVKNIKAVKITYNQVRPEIEKITLLLKDFNEIRLYHFPLCTLPGKIWSSIWRTLPEDGVVFVKACQGCNFKKYCLGVPKDYSEIIGTKEFKAIKKDFIIHKTDDFYHPISRVIYK